MDLLTRTVEDLVQRALAGEAPLETLLSRHCLGRDPSDDDAAWPADVQQLWNLCVRRYFDLRNVRPSGNGRRRRRAQNVPTVASAWAAILAFAPDPERWWIVPGLSWPALVPHLQCGSRAIHYHLYDVQGWRFRGRGPNRRVVYAPCAACAEPTSASELRERRCPACRD